MRSLRRAWPILAFICVASRASSAGTRPLVGLNDAPVLNAAASPALQPTYQGALAPANGTVVGTPVSLLVDFATPADGLDNVTDLDASENDGAGSAQLGIAITALGTGGTWYYSTNNGAVWSPAPVVSASASLLLTANTSTRLYFVPTGNTVSSTLTFRAWDGATGTNGATANTTSNGGTTAYSSASDVATIAVRGVRMASSNITAGSSNLTVPPITGVAAGDLVVVCVSVSPTATITNSAFTQLINLDQSSATTSRLYVGYRVATASEPSYTFSFSGTPSAAGGAIAFTGMNTTSPVEGSSASATLSSTSHAAPSITPALARTLLNTWHAYASSSSWTPPAGMTEYVDVNTSQGSGGVSLEGNTQLLSTSGATGTRTATATGNADRGTAASIAWRFANMAPVLDNSASPTLADVSEGAPAPSGAVGTLVSALVDFIPPLGGWDNVTDDDGGATTGIAITAANSANGSWYYSTNNGSAWLPLGTPTTTVARLLSSDGNTRLYFQPNADFSGTITNAITFRAWDGTAGTNGSTADASVSGGSTAFSVNADGADITVIGVNDPPTSSAPPTANTLEDTNLNWGPLSVGDADNDVLQVGLSCTSGTLSVSTGGPITVTGNHTSTMQITGTPAAVNTALATAVYAPTQDYNGTSLLTLSVSDGAAFAPLANTNATILPVVDIANDAISTNEDSPPTPNLLANDTFENPTRTITGVTQGTNGTVSLVGNSSVTYTPNLNFNGTDGFTYTVTSAGVTETGSVSVTVVPVNDPPLLNTAADPTLSPVTEDAPAPSGAVGTLVSALVDLNPPASGLNNVTDVDAGALTGLAIVMVNDFLGTAYYSLNNGTNWSPVGPVNMSSARTLAADGTTRVYFAPAADLSGGITPFSFVAWDQTTGTNGGLSNANGGGSGTSAFSAASDELYMIVTAVNDAPQATNINTGEAYALNTPLNLVDIVVSDVDHATTNVSLSLSNTTAGSLNTATSGAVTSTYNSGTGVWSASGAIADVNTLLAGLTFTPANNFASDFTIAVQVSDGVAPPLSGSKLMTGPGAPVIAIIPRVVLEGSYNATTGLMNGAMRTAGLVPVTEPYTALGYTYTGTVGGSTTPAVLAVGGADAVHDWVIVELRSAANPATVVYSRAALLQRDGQVCDLDGVSPITFGVPPGSYYLAVRHRNHLGAMTAAAIGYTATPSFVDMAAIGFPCYGTEAQKTISGSFPAQVLWAGDVSFNGQLKYTGSGNDRDPILIAVGSTTPNNTPALYSTADVNLDGVVKYTGSANDRDPILVNVGSTTPNNVRVQQVP